jgi:hypothetical protein
MNFKLVLEKVTPLFLITTFFVLHEYCEYYPAVPIKEAIGVLLLFTFTAVILFCLTFLFFRNLHKTVTYALVLMLVYLFYGATHDFLKNVFVNSFFVSYKFFIPFLAVLLLFTGMIVRRSQPMAKKHFRFINLLLIVMIVYELMALMLSAKKSEKNKVNISAVQTTISNLQVKPDIYLIVTDEYAGLNVLNEVFGYDNSNFVNDLNNRNFHFLKQTKSNYNATIFSMASILNLNYLKLNTDTITLQNTLECGNLLDENAFVQFLKRHNYTFHNFSQFDIDNQSKAVRVYFFPTFKELFTSQTVIERIRKDIGYNFMSTKKIKELENHNLRNDSVVDILTRNVVKESVSPKFVYTHFNMPHHPFFINKDTNNSLYSKLELSKDQDKKAYINYLEFANKKLLDLIDFIKKNSANPPIILLMSDHGWRGNETSAQNDLQFANINAIHLPDSNYKYFYDGMSNVNQMRMLLNTYFAQNLSRLADTTIFLKEVVNQ